MKKIHLDSDGLKNSLNIYWSIFFFYQFVSEFSYDFESIISWNYVSSMTQKILECDVEFRYKNIYKIQKFSKMSKSSKDSHEFWKIKNPSETKKQQFTYLFIGSHFPIC